MTDANPSELDAKISQLVKRIEKQEKHLNVLHDFVRQFSEEAIETYNLLLKWKNQHIGQHNAVTGGRHVKEWKGAEWHTDMQHNIELLEPEATAIDNQSSPNTKVSGQQSCTV